MESKLDRERTKDREKIEESRFTTEELGITMRLKIVISGYGWRWDV